MGSTKDRGMALFTVVGLFVLMAWTSPSSAQYVDPSPSGGSCVIVSPQDDAARLQDPRTSPSALRDLWSAWLGSFAWRLAPTHVHPSSRSPRVRDLPVADLARERVKMMRR
jgi:hypothetical protein